MTRLATRLALCLALLLLAGRWTVPAAAAAPAAPAGTTVSVTLTNNHRVVIDDKAYPLEELGKRLKKSGATPEDEIRIHIPQDTPVDALNQMTRDLIANGYRKFFFMKPRRAEAVVEPVGKK